MSVAAEAVGIAKDFATGAAALTAALVAVRGLQTWKRQLHGNANYELARRVLRATYKLREAINHVRRPFMHAAEIAEAYQVAALKPGENPEGKRDEEVTYHVRWKVISEAQVEFNAEMLEAEALWGHEIKEASKAFLNCLGELNKAIYFWLKGDLKSNAAKDAEIMQTIYDLADEPNKYSDKVAAAIKGIEDQVRPHLKL